jgi:hypothetical protein
VERLTSFGSNSFMRARRQQAQQPTGIAPIAILEAGQRGGQRSANGLWQRQAREPFLQLSDPPPKGSIAPARPGREVLDHSDGQPDRE